MIKKMSSIILSIILFAFFLILGCNNTDTEKIEFVKQGIPQFLSLSENCKQQENYLQTGNPFFINTEKVIYGDDIEVKMQLSLGKGDAHINIIVADNTFCITNRYGNQDEKSVFLWGPSINQTINLGKVTQYVTMDSLFEWVVSYKNEILSYEINGHRVYAQKPVIKPAGMLKLNESSDNFRIYNVSASGKFKPIKEFYNREFLLNRARKSVDRTAVRVKDDPNRPAFHFLPRANWNNDPNGMLYYEGYYHMFYQHNPYSDDWDWMHWGHARSTDLVYWEHLPIALWPSVEKGESHCFSGSGYIRDNGEPILFYTSIGHDDPQHWAALPLDDNLLEWQKHPADPILLMDDHDGLYINEWRDPYLFRENGETYMVIGGHPIGGTGSIMLYEALNPELTEWRYLGIPFSGEEWNWECPNFFKLDDKYVLIYSPHGRVKYFTGKLDLNYVEFTPEFHGAIDNGANGNYYAPNTLQKGDGRRILFGWLPGFKKGQGWQGAISLPRELSINENGQLIQNPAEELTKLRKEILHKTDLDVNKKPLKIKIDRPQFELKLDMGENGAENVGFQFIDETDKLYKILLKPDVFAIGNEIIPVNPVLSGRIKTVQLFFDQTVIEIFVNGGIACATKVIYPQRDNFNFEIFCEEEETVIEDLYLWEMKSIWSSATEPESVSQSAIQN